LSLHTYQIGRGDKDAISQTTLGRWTTRCGHAHCRHNNTGRWLVVFKWCGRVFPCGIKLGSSSSFISLSFRYISRLSVHSITYSFIYYNILLKITKFIIILLILNYIILIMIYNTCIQQGEECLCRKACIYVLFLFMLTTSLFSSHDSWKALACHQAHN
jgi:hypothetical protein